MWIKAESLELKRTSVDMRLFLCFPDLVPSLDFYKYNNIRPPYTYAYLIRWVTIDLSSNFFTQTIKRLLICNNMLNIIHHLLPLPHLYCVVWTLMLYSIQHL